MLFQMDAGVRRAEMDAMEKLDGLEKHLQWDLLEGSERGAVVDTRAGDSEVRVRGTLLCHIDAWVAAGAGPSRWE